MIDLRVKARGLEFDCLGLAECCAERVSARCPCTRRVVDAPPPQRMRRRDAIHATNPPAPKFGDLLGEAIRRRYGQANG